MSDNRPADVGRALEMAVSARRNGRVDDAERHLRHALELEAGNPIALNMLGMIALERGDAASAAETFRQATRSDPGAGALWMNLAKASRLIGDDEGERSSLLRVLEIDQLDLPALIRLAEYHERRGEFAPAAKRWNGVVALGRQIVQRSPDLDRILAHAEDFLGGRMTLFASAIDEGLSGAREQLDSGERRRFDAAIDAMLGRRRIYQNECSALHFPFLPADEFFERRHFPWMAQLEAKSGAIRAELETLLVSSADAFTPYVAMQAGTPDTIWTKLDHSLDWSALHLRRHGEPIEDVCDRCPATVAALAAVPQPDIPRRSPTAFFSVLKPHTHIPPHGGVTNIRATCHLPLVVPPNCRFRVGGETREWREGEAFAFDDTIEHEAWNDSDQVRAVLIFDVWNPHLGEAEKALLRTFYGVADASGFDPGMLDDA